MKNLPKFPVANEAEAFVLYPESEAPKPAPRNHLGVRPDVFGWIFVKPGDKDTSCSEGAPQNPDFDPGGLTSVCPFCCRVANSGIIKCRCLPKICVKVTVEGGNQMISGPVQFFYRYHGACYDAATQKMIDDGIRALEI